MVGGEGAVVGAVGEVDEVAGAGVGEGGGELVGGGGLDGAQRGWDGWERGEDRGRHRRGRYGGRRGRPVTGDGEGGLDLGAAVVRADPGGEGVLARARIAQRDAERRVPVIEYRVAVEGELDPLDLVQGVRARGQGDLGTALDGLPFERARAGAENPAAEGAGRGGLFGGSGEGARVRGGRGCRGGHRLLSAPGEEDADDDDEYKPGGADPQPQPAPSVRQRTQVQPVPFGTDVGAFAVEIRFGAGVAVHGCGPHPLLLAVPASEFGLYRSIPGSFRATCQAVRAELIGRRADRA